MGLSPQEFVSVKLCEENRVAKILVTGAAGFLGFALASKLAEDPSNHVVATDNFVRGERDEAYLALSSKPNVEAVELDLSELDQVRMLPPDVQVIFHMAALNGTQNFYERPFEVVRCCTLPTMHLLDVYGPSKALTRFVYAGSSEAYASTVTLFNWEVPTAEDVPLGVADVFNVRWSYGGSKMHGEIACIAAADHYKLPITIVQFHNAYGPRMGDKHVIPDFYNRASKGVFELYGYADTRSFIYVDDAVRATIELALVTDAQGQVVNVGGSDEIRIEDLGHKMMAAARLHGDIVLHPSPAGSVKRRAPKLDKLRALIGYSPRWSLEDGLAATARHYLGDAYRGK